MKMDRILKTSFSLKVVFYFYFSHSVLTFFKSHTNSEQLSQFSSVKQILLNVLNAKIETCLQRLVVILLLKNSILEEQSLLKSDEFLDSKTIASFFVLNFRISSIKTFVPQAL